MAKKRAPFPSWRDDYALAGGLFFLAICSTFLFSSGVATAAGAVFFVAASVMLLHAREVQAHQKGTWADTYRSRVIESLSVFVLGLIMQLTLPSEFIQSSFLVTILGLTMFVYHKFHRQMQK